MFEGKNAPAGNQQQAQDLECVSHAVRMYVYGFMHSYMCKHVYICGLLSGGHLQD